MSKGQEFDKVKRDAYASIESCVASIEPIAESLRGLGIPVGDKLAFICDKLDGIVKKLRDNDSAELNEQYQQTLQGSANMLAACIAGTEVGRVTALREVEESKDATQTSPT
jgi:hypothetical protein